MSQGKKQRDFTVAQHVFPERENAVKLATRLIEQGIQFSYEPKDNSISYPARATPDPSPQIEIKYES